MYSMGACAVLGISNQDALNEDLENDPFLNLALQRFTCDLYYRFGSFLAMAAELMIGFWFGIRVILAVKMVHSLEDCIEELISRK